MMKLVETLKFMHYPFINSTTATLPPSDFAPTKQPVTEKESPIFASRSAWTPPPDTVRHFLRSSEEEFPESPPQWPDTVRHFWHSNCQSVGSTSSPLVRDDEEDLSSSPVDDDYESRGAIRGICSWPLEDQQQQEFHSHSVESFGGAETDVEKDDDRETAFIVEQQKQKQQQQPENEQQQSVEAAGERLPPIEPKNSIISGEEKREKESDNDFESNRDGATLYERKSTKPAELVQKSILITELMAEEFADGDASQATLSESDAEHITEEPTAVDSDASSPHESAERSPPCTVKRDFRITKLPLLAAQCKSDATLYRSFYMPNAVGKALTPTANGARRPPEKLLTAVDVERMMVYLLN